MSTLTRLSPRRRRAHRFARHHLVLAGASAIMLLLVAILDGAHDWNLRWSIATGYAGALWLSVTLVLGPLNILRARPNPVSTDLRRAIGIWSALLGGAHVLIVLPMYWGGLWRSLLRVFEPPGLMPQPFDDLAFANQLGLAASIVLVLLAMLSNDAALRTLRPRRWKALQRLNYGLFGIVVLHAVLYERIEHRPWPFVVAFGALVAGVIGLQLAGVWRYKRRSLRGAGARIQAGSGTNRSCWCQQI